MEQITKYKPLIIGIAGPSGSGKSLLANTIVSEIGSQEVVVISEDAYYKSHNELTFEERTKINYDHPNAFDHDLFSQQLTQLQDGKTVQVPLYDHTLHARKKETRRIGKHAIIVLEGILLLVDASLREKMDICIFMDTPLDICLLRRLQRDIVERHRSIESVLQQYEDTVRPMYLQFIEPSKRYADILKGDLITPPANTVCYDEPDPYFVVAADKGTATFSDIANTIAKSYGYWLGDAFASGGSAGYDHKKIGITARGAWESVKRHFKELAMNIETNAFTVVGIGDMAGDVFGNGMLLSQQIKLVAALNGTHIFIDPNPNPALSFKERQRLFQLPRSSWEDYNPKLISEGGGVFKRSSKSIKLSAEAMAVLGIKEKALPPNELIKALLMAPVDLLWNGGIGTFVKASTETHLDVGDRSNDATRVDANALRCRVVGEGGNLGFTQLARIEYALSGGHINTDFIDNSAGVDCSDHEVNIKIVLNELLARKQMTERKRNALLVQMTEEVSQLVLRHNYQQARTVSNATLLSINSMNAYAHYLKNMEKQGKIDRQLEFLPDDEQIALRRSNSKGLTRPEIAVLVAYSKIILKAQIIASDLVDDPSLHRYIAYAFPMCLSKAPYVKLITHHRLRNEIIATQLANLMVNHMGILFVDQIRDETSASLSNVVRAYFITLETFQLLPLLDAISSLPVDTALDFKLTFEVTRFMRRTIRWLLLNQRDLSIRQHVELFTRGISQLDTHLLNLLTDEERTALEQKSENWVNVGVPQDIAQRIALMPVLFPLLNIIKTTHTCRGNLQQIARLYFQLSRRLELESLHDVINDFPADSQWMSLAIAAAKGSLYTQQRTLVLNIYRFNRHARQPMDSLDAWFETHSVAIARWQTIFMTMKGSHPYEHSMLAVVIRELNELANATRAIV